MRCRRLFTASFAVLAIGPSASADAAPPPPPPPSQSPSQCAVVTDPERDVALAPVQNQQRVDEESHVDLTAVTMKLDHDQLVVYFHVRELSEFREGRWSVTFRSTSPARMYVQAQAHVGPTPDGPMAWRFDAGSSEGTFAFPTGRADAATSTIRVNVRLSAFGRTLDPRGYLSDFRATSEASADLGTMLDATRTVRLFDEGTGARAFNVARGRCEGNLVRAAVGGPGCLVTTDEVGDVEVDGVAGSDRVDDRHLDLRRIEVWTVGGRLTVWVDVRSFDPRRPGAWTVTFASGRSRLFVRAEAQPTADRSSPLSYTFTAGRVGTTGHVVTGGLGERKGALRVTAPLAAFDKTVTRSSRLREFAAEAELRAGPAPRLHDVAPRGTETYLVSGRCGHQAFAAAS